MHTGDDLVVWWDRAAAARQAHNPEDGGSSPSPAISIWFYPLRHFSRYVERLFLKYIKTTLLAGILTVLISLTLYFRADFTALKNLNILFDVWFYFVIMFLLLTYRCTSSILELLFTDDTELLNPLFGKKDDSEQKKKDALNEYFGDKG